MQDRFRFRAWYKTKKEMSYDTELTYDYFIGVGTESHDNFGDVLEDENYIVMQCTGLKDKNGKLIYEKDYIKINNNKYKIIFNKYKISLVNIINNDIIDWEEQFKGEIIGNEYEGYFK